MNVDALCLSLKHVFKLYSSREYFCNYSEMKLLLRALWPVYRESSGMYEHVHPCKYPLKAPFVKYAKHKHSHAQVLFHLHSFFVCFISIPVEMPYL